MEPSRMKFAFLFFMKQIGSNPYRYSDTMQTDIEWPIRDRKGGDMEDWPEYLRVREFSSQKAEAVNA